MNKNKDYYDQIQKEFEDTISEIEKGTSIHALEKYAQNVDDDNDIFSVEDEIRTLYFYPLRTLSGRELNGIPVSRDKLTVCCIQKEKEIKVSAYMSGDNNYGIDATPNMENVSESIIDVVEKLEFQIQGMEYNGIFQPSNFYIITTEPITAENVETILMYVNDQIRKDLIIKENMKINISAIPINKMSQNLRIKPIHILLRDPIDFSFSQVIIESPQGAIGGTVKLKLENDYDYPLSLYPNTATPIHPRLIFPVQFKPNTMLLDFWNSRQILNIYEFFELAKNLNINLNEPFSLQQFMQLGSSTTPSAIQVPNVQYLEFDVNYDGRERRRGNPNIFNFTNRTKHLKVDMDNLNIFYDYALSDTTGGSKSLYTDKPWVDIAGQLFTEYQEATKINYVINLKAVPRDLPDSTIAFDVVKKMMTYSYWKDREFDGAIKIVERDGQFVEEINDKDIYLLRKQFEGQDRYSIVTNLWLSFKKQNPELVNNNKEKVQQIESMLTMLSGHLKSNYSINKGDNDDYKVILPFYFELVNAPDQPIQYVEYTDIYVRLKSSYYSFEQNTTTKDWKLVPNLPNKNQFNYNAYFQLENNIFAFPDLTTSIETSAIPSTLPADINLANGEYSKYLLYINELPFEKNITFGNGDIIRGLWNYKIRYNFSDKVGTNINPIREFIITAINGHVGKWSFHIRNKTTYEFELNLFDAQNTRMAVQTIIV